MKEMIQEEIDFDLLLAPETALEKKLMQHPRFLQGLTWGKPRYGHPEGQVGLHIREVLDNIDKLTVNQESREWLRLIAFTHDTFKYEENKSQPWSHERHHGHLAKVFLQEIRPNHQVLDIIDYHDEAYFAWRDIHLYKNPERGENRLQQLLEKMQDQRQLYYAFFKCDTQTGDKTQAPVKWFEKVVTDIDLVNF